MKDSISSNSVVLIGPTSKHFKGGIVHFTEELFYKIKGTGLKVKLIAFSRSYPKKLFPGKVINEDNKFSSMDIEYVLDWLNPFSWINTFITINKANPKIVVFQWWTWFWALPYLVVLILLKLFSKSSIVLFVHNSADHEQKKIKSFVARVIFKFADKFIVTTRDAEKELGQEYPKNKVTLSPHPMYEFLEKGPEITKNVARDKLKLKNEPLLLFFGHIRDYKGLDILLAAMKKVVKVNRSIQLLVVGEFWKNEDKYKKMISNYKLDNNVRVIGEYVPDKDIQLYYKAADALVMPYKTATGTGVSKIALYYDLPIIGTIVGDLKDYFEPSGAGIFVEPNNIDALYRAIMKFINSDKSMYAKSMKELKETFSWEKLIDKIKS
jgi:glycosyltransferase involved in cell wall biosynthesis